MTAAPSPDFICWIFAALKLQDAWDGAVCSSSLLSLK
jgi:hypothetical protein